MCQSKGYLPALFELLLLQVEEQWKTKLAQLEADNQAISSQIEDANSALDHLKLRLETAEQKAKVSPQSSSFSRYKQA